MKVEVQSRCQEDVDEGALMTTAVVEPNNRQRELAPFIIQNFALCSSSPNGIHCEFLLMVFLLVRFAWWAFS